MTIAMIAKFIGGILMGIAGAMAYDKWSKDEEDE